MHFERRSLFLRPQPMCGTESSRQSLFNDSDVFDRTIVSCAWTLARDVSVGDDVNLVTQVIEGKHAIEEHQHAVRHVQIVFRALANALQLTDHVIGKIPDRSCCEWWQAFDLGRLVLAKQ